MLNSYRFLDSPQETSYFYATMALVLGLEAVVGTGGYVAGFTPVHGITDAVAIATLAMAGTLHL